MDDRVAWVHIAIPSIVFSGETSDDWYSLSGRLGEEREGMVNLVLSHSVCDITLPHSLLYL
jgi:toll-interacting protein